MGQAKSLKRQLIKLTDSGEAGWDAVQEYESQGIASDDEDNKKIRYATAAASKKRKEGKGTAAEQ